MVNKIKKSYKYFIILFLFFSISWLNYYNFFDKSFTYNILYQISINEKDKKNKILSFYYNSRYSEHNHLITKISQFKKKFGEKYKFFAINNDQFVMVIPFFHEQKDYLTNLSEEINFLFINDLTISNNEFLDEIKLKKKVFQIKNNEINQILYEILINDKNYDNYLKYKKKNELNLDFEYYSKRNNLTVQQTQKKFNYMLVFAYAMNQLLIITLSYFLHKELFKNKN